MSRHIQRPDDISSPDEWDETLDKMELRQALRLERREKERLLKALEKFQQFDGQGDLWGQLADEHDRMRDCIQTMGDTISEGTHEAALRAMHHGYNVLRSLGCGHLHRAN